jgi:hypothetical protein
MTARRGRKRVIPVSSLGGAAVAFPDDFIDVRTTVIVAVLAIQALFEQRACWQAGGPLGVFMEPKQAFDESDPFAHSCFLLCVVEKSAGKESNLPNVGT